MGPSFAAYESDVMGGGARLKRFCDSFVDDDGRIYVDLVTLSGSARSVTSSAKQKI